VSTPVPAPAASRDQAPERAPLSAAKERTGSGSVPVVGIVLSLCLLALSAVLVRDALVLLGVLGGTPWLQTAVGAVSGTVPATWMVPAGVALGLFGLWLLTRAFARRRRTEVRLRSRTAVTTTPRDLARLSSAVARDVDGVLGASTAATRRAITVTISTTGAGSVREAVEQQVADRLAPLERSPSVRVKVEEGRR